MNENSINWINFSYSTESYLGACTRNRYWSWGKYYLNYATILINSRHNWRYDGGGMDPNGGYDYMTVVIHEFGHAAGLNHSYEPWAVLFGSVNYVKLSLHQDDKNNLISLYGAP